RRTTKSASRSTRPLNIRRVATKNARGRGRVSLVLRSLATTLTWTSWQPRPSRMGRRTTNSTGPPTAKSRPQMPMRVTQSRLDSMRWIAEEPRLATIEHQHAVAHATNDGQGVRHEGDRRPALPNLGHVVEALPLERQVAHRQDLVDEQDVGFRLDRHREPQAY